MKTSEIIGEIEEISLGGLRGLYLSPRKKLSPYPIVMVHGMWCTAAFFKPLMFVLAALGFECYAITLRGHGESKPVQDLGKVGMEDYIQDVQLFLEALGCPPYILIGHSMGELIASQVASRNKQLVVAHIGITSAPPSGVIMGIKTIIRMMCRPRYLWEMFKGKTITLDTKDAQALLFNTLKPADAQVLIRQLVAESGTAAREITLGKYTMEKLACPSLVIAGTHDSITPHQVTVAKRLGAEFKKLNTGHMVTSDPNFNQVGETISTWLRQKKFA